MPRQHLRALFSDSSSGCVCQSELAAENRARLLERGDASRASETESAKARLAACSAEAPKLIRKVSPIVSAMDRLESVNLVIAALHASSRKLRFRWKTPVEQNVVE